MMKSKFEPIPDPTFEQGFEGLYVGDLQEHHLDQPTEEILLMFRK